MHSFRLKMCSATIDLKHIAVLEGRGDIADIVPYSYISQSAPPQLVCRNWALTFWEDTTESYICQGRKISTILS